MNVTCRSLERQRLSFAIVNGLVSKTHRGISLTGADSHALVPSEITLFPPLLGEVTTPVERPGEVRLQADRWCV